MKTKIIILMIGALLIGVNLYAAGDLIVNGGLAVGTSTIYGSINTESTDASAFKVTAIKDSNPFLNGSTIALNVNAADASSNSLQVFPQHFNTASTGGIMRGALYNTYLVGGGSLNAAVGMQNQIVLKSPNNYTINTIRGNEVILTKGGGNIGTHTITNLYGLTSFGTNAGGGVINGTDWRHAYFQNWPGFDGTVASVAGLWIDKQTLGTVNKGIVLNGDGNGADIVFGSGACCRIYSEAGTLRAQDGAGNITTFSPHDPETGEWIFYSKNINTGRTVRVNMEQLVKAVEKLTGETFMMESLVGDK